MSEGDDTTALICYAAQVGMLLRDNHNLSADLLKQAELARITRVCYEQGRTTVEAASILNQWSARA